VALAASSLQVGQRTSASATVRNAAGATLSGRSVTWSSSNSSVATVVNGEVTAVAPGSADIIATSEGRSGSASVTVTPVPVATVRLSLALSSIEVGQSTAATAQALDANGAVLSGRAVTWASASPNIATVSNGQVTAIAPGTAQITATIEGRSANATITVTPIAVASVRVTLASTSITVGQGTTAKAEALSATGAVLTGRSFTWTSASPAIATVVNGQVIGVAPGTAQITATSEGRIGGATITVTPVPVASVSLSTDSADVPLRASTTLVATPRDGAGQPLTGRTVTWSTSAAAIATVTGGVVRVLQPGTVTITATIEGRTATARVRGVLADLTTMADSMRLARGLPALGVAIVSREGLIGIGVSGTRQVGGGGSVTRDDRWHLGSNTKALTGVLAGMAVQAGVISWDATLRTSFPDLAGVMRPEYQPVTLRELFNHTSGFINSVANAPAGSTNLSTLRTQWVSATLAEAPQNPRGTYYYSNNGYGAAGSMIERAWGQSFEALMESRLFAPLGVSSLVGWGPADAIGQVGVSGHSWNGSSWVVCARCDNRPVLSAAGTMNATLGGWARIIQELLRADQGQSALLTQTMARTLTTGTSNGPENYGFGWSVSTNPNNRFVAHDGSNTTNRSRATLFLDPGVAFLIVTNAADTGTMVNTYFGSFQLRLDSYWANGR
jgi:CubicO group peptidase (beta-lactamase class C family)